MYCVQEQDVIGDRTEAPYARVVKHLVAPWNAGSSKIWMALLSFTPPGRKGLMARSDKMPDVLGFFWRRRKYLY
jgi:hypothetical protein